MIRFTKYTSVVERVGIEALFPFCTYEPTPYSQLPRPSDMPERFTDVLGVISGVSDAIQYHTASRAEPSTKRLINIKDLSGSQITVTLWGSRASDFDANMVKELRKTGPVIVIFVGTLVKVFEGRRGVSASATCRWYINEDLPDITSFRQGLHGQVPAIEYIRLAGQTDAEIEAQINLETKTVKELVALDIFDYQDARFYCTATLTRMSPGQRWWFSSCTTCHKSSSAEGASYRCSDASCLGTDALPRYKICFIAASDGVETEFVFFDRVGRELLGSPLLTILRHGHAPGVELARVLDVARADDSVPKELTSIISRKFRFVVSISNKIYQNPSEMGELSFQVHRIDPVAGRQSQSSMHYRASSSTSDSALASSLNNPSSSAGPSPDLLCGEALSPEGRVQIDLLSTPPSVTKPPPPSVPKTQPSASVRRGLFTDETSPGANEKMTATDKAEIAESGGMVVGEAVDPPLSKAELAKLEKQKKVRLADA